VKFNFTGVERTNAEMYLHSFDNANDYKKIGSSTCFLSISINPFLLLVHRQYLNCKWLY